MNPGAVLFPTMYEMLIGILKSSKYRCFIDIRLNGWRRRRRRRRRRKARVRSAPFGSNNKCLSKYFEASESRGDILDSLHSLFIWVYLCPGQCFKILLAILQLFVSNNFFTKYCFQKTHPLKNIADSCLFYVYQQEVNVGEYVAAKIVSFKLVS